MIISHKYVFLRRNMSSVLLITVHLGLSGFDSGQEWYVSRQCSVGLHYKKTVNNYLATTTLLLLLDRSTVDLLNHDTRCCDKTSPGSSCSEARRYGGAVKSGIVPGGFAS